MPFGSAHCVLQCAREGLANGHDQRQTTHHCVSGSITGTTAQNWEEQGNAYPVDEGGKAPH